MSYLMIGLVITFSSCNSNNDPAPAKDESPLTLVQSTRVFKRQAGDLRGLISASGLNVDVDRMQYNVTMYKVNYNTDYKGDSVTASAVVLVPETDQPVYMLSFQHGTIASNAEAPTQVDLGDGMIVLNSALASTGCVVVVPDFIGFGASADVVHPYYVEDLTATSIINSLYAAKQVAKDLSIDLNNKLYLAGYSQGGYATMAAHKYFEEHTLPYFELQASFPSSGGYDINGFQEYFFGLKTYHEPFFMAYVADAYKVTYDWTQSMDKFFNEPYASAIPGYFDGSYSGSQINDMLNDTIAVLVNNEFLTNVDKAEYDFITTAFKDNSPIGWVPKIPVFMYHGDADITVPYQNSVNVYNQFIADGASKDIVTFTTLPGATHGTGVGPYIEDFVGQLAKMEP